MDRLSNLKSEVERLYKEKNPQADPWNDWGYDNHVLVVAQNASRLAKDKNANEEYCVAGALLHDIADAVMHRSEPNHEEKSLEIARDLLNTSGFSQDEVDSIVRDVIKHHGCNEQLPESMEGKILATADAMAHFQTDFYLYFCWNHYGRNEFKVFKEWVVEKIEKDYKRKIFFDDVREPIKENYESILKLFSS